jgi:hypothetical protein
VALAQVRKGSIIQNQVIDYKVILSIHFRNVQKAFDANRIHGQIDKTKLFNRKLDLRSSGEEHFDAILCVPRLRAQLRGVCHRADHASAGCGPDRRKPYR